jgi:hypothetical protein
MFLLAAIAFCAAIANDYALLVGLPLSWLRS